MTGMQIILNMPSHLQFVLPFLKLSDLMFELFYGRLQATCPVLRVSKMLIS